MEETLLRDRVEIERRRDEAKQLDRINAIERALAVLQTVFDAHREHAITHQDLNKLQKDAEAEMIKQINHICEHFDTKTEQQSKDLLSKVDGMFSSYQTQAMTAQLEAMRRTRGELIRYGMGFAVTVLSGLAIIWFTK